MPLNAIRLAKAVRTDLEGQGFDFEKVDFARKLIESMAKQVILEIQTNALVTGPVAVASVSGVTTGPGASGPGAGTLTAGTIL